MNSSKSQPTEIDDSESRYQALKQFLDAHHMTVSDKKAFDEALAWSDQASLLKQCQEECAQKMQTSI